MKWQNYKTITIVNGYLISVAIWAIDVRFFTIGVLVLLGMCYFLYVMDA
jgi:hypothetical protein